MHLQAGTYLGAKDGEVRVGGFRCITRRYFTGLVLPEHSHECAHFCYTISGSFVEGIDGVSHRRIPGMLVYYPPGAVHTESHDEIGRHLIIDLNTRCFETIADLGISPAVPVTMVAGCSASQLVHELHRGNDVSPLAVEALAWELVGSAARVAKRGTWPNWLGRVRDALIETYAAPPTVSELASTFSVHPVHLSKAFRQRFGRTVGGFVRELRIDNACRLLRDARLSLSQIALECGFVDQSHMGRVFRQRLGLTPLEFRKDTHRSIGEHLNR